MILIKEITPETKAALQLKNEPFEIRGRMLVTRTSAEWQHEVTLFEEKTQMTFPDEAYDFDAIVADGFALGAYDYDSGKCVGLAIMKNDWFKYMYLTDLKVNQAYRKQGVAYQLIEAALYMAQERGYAGIFTIGQDNNVNACEFYLRSGFEIGGYNTRGYRHTVQEDKADIYFYWDAPKSSNSYQ